MTNYSLTEKDHEHEHNKTLTGSADFKGPISNRSCTDPLFFLLLLAAWGVMSWIGKEALTGGYVSVLTKGYDWEGNICEGATPYFLPVNIKTMGVCVEECPTTYDPTVFNCIGGNAVGNPANAADVTNGYCLPQYPTKAIMNRCLVTNTTALEVLDLVSSYKGLSSSMLTSFYGDVLTARAYIFGIGFGAALILGFLWTWLLRAPGLIFVAVWIICFMVFGFLGLLGALMYNFSEDWKNDIPQTHSDREIWGAKGLGIFFLVCCGLWGCMLLATRKRINLAIGLVKESARAVIAMPLMVLYPFLQALGLLAFLVPWAFFSIYVASLGEFKTEAFTGLVPGGGSPTIQVERFNYGSAADGYAWYMLFVLLWTAQFIVAVGQITLALAVATWYFTRDKDHIGSGTLWSAMKTTGRFHLGTAAFGSLIIAIVEFIRAIIAYFQKKAKDTKNKVAEWVLCCCQCCMWCLENCLKFINKNAYIQTAVFGTSFCTSAKKGFFLIARNILRVGAVTLVSEFVIIIGKVFISAFAGGISYYLMEYLLKDELNSPIGPTILVVILAWFTANMFCEIFSMAVITMLQAFIADEEMFAPEERFAGPELTKYIDNNGKHPDLEGQPSASSGTPRGATPRGTGNAGEIVAKVAV